MTITNKTAGVVILALMALGMLALMCATIGAGFVPQALLLWGLSAVGLSYFALRVATSPSYPVYPVTLGAYPVTKKPAA
jgi:hypothetical protein